MSSISIYLQTLRTKQLLIHLTIYLWYMMITAEWLNVPVQGIKRYLYTIPCQLLFFH